MFMNCENCSIRFLGRKDHSVYLLFVMRLLPNPIFRCHDPACTIRSFEEEEEEDAIPPIAITNHNSSHCLDEGGG